MNKNRQLILTNLFKRGRKYPPFTSLQAFDNVDCYFIRIAPWRWIDRKQIIVNDPQRTIKEYIYFMADLYSSKIPEALDSTVIDEINTLLDLGLIKLSSVKLRPDSLHDLQNKK